MRFRRNLIYFIIQLFIDEKKDRNIKKKKIKSNMVGLFDKKRNT